MRARRPDRIDVAEADRLVSGSCSDPQPYGLGLLLDAASAPAFAEELAGEEEMVTRLVEARRVALSNSQGRSHHDAQVSPARKTVAVRLAAAMASLLLVAVIAAAETGSLPDPVQQRAHELFSLLGVPAPDEEGQQGGTPSGDVRPIPTAPVPTQSPDPSPAATGTLDPTGAQARVLCRAWNTAGRDPNGAAMDGSSWRALVELAGGRTRVPGLCAALLDTASSAGTASTAVTSHPGAGPANPSRSVGGKKYGSH